MDNLSIAQSVFKSEIFALEHVGKNLDYRFDKAVQLILNCKGRVIVCGMGKSGLVGKKISASLSSTGTPSFFVHPGEAIHGDLGMICGDDVFIGISYSGETSELTNILPYLKEIKVPIIALTSSKVSTLGRSSRVVLDVTVPNEACPLQLAPTSSSTAALVLGDALTIALMNERGFTEAHFARFHPGGSLGRKLLSSIRSEMVSESLPLVRLDDSLVSVLDVITSGGLGLCVVVEVGEIKGVITDGDLRRAIKKCVNSFGDCKAIDIMTSNPVTIHVEDTMVNALNLMEKKCINRLLVVEDDTLLGILKK